MVGLEQHKYILSDQCRRCDPWAQTNQICQPHALIPMVNAGTLLQMLSHDVEPWLILPRDAATAPFEKFHTEYK